MQFFRRALTPLCNKCGLDKQCLTPKQPIYGRGEKGILIVGTSPSPEEDYTGRREESRDHDLLKGALGNLGIDLERDCWWINAVNCIPYNKKQERRAPTDTEMDSCRPMLQKALRDLKPSTIVLFGEFAIKSLYTPEGLQFLKVEQYRGKRIPDAKIGAWVTATYGIEEMVAEDYNQNKRMIFDFDINNAASLVSLPVPVKIDYDSRVHILTEFKDVEFVLNQVIDGVPEYFVHDYEANTFKPYRDFARLYSMSFKTALDAHAFSFPVHWPGHWSNEQEGIVSALIRRILSHRRIGKIAHNMGMEDSWAAVRLEVVVAPWLWDTMISQHILDTTPNTKGLKDQAWFRYGVHGYDDEVEPYLKSAAGTEKNTIHKAPKHLILHYGGLDSVFTEKLFLDQRDEIQYKAQDDPIYSNVNTLFKEGGIVLNRISQRGFRVDEEFYTEQATALTAEIEKTTTALLNSREARAFRAETGRQIKLNSSDDVRFLLTNILGYTVDKRTKTDQEAMDKETLQEIGTRFAKNLLSLRKADKILGTYVAPFLKGAVDGRIHPNFNLHVARSGRSSSSAPNFQNLPKRDPLSKRYVRRGIIPDPGFHFCEADYSSLEVRIFACHCLDPVLIDYVNDPTTDMHRDQCVDLFMLPNQEYVSKAMRGDIKAGWVFAEFYGSYYKSCARKMWDTMISPRKIKLRDPVTGKDGPTLMDHLDDMGIRCHADFEAYLKDYEENNFWARFAVTKEYQKNAFKEYQRKGYIETKWGFRRGGFLSRNKIINTPTQGTGFQNLLWSLVEMDKQRRREKWQSFFVGQIHDSINSNIHPDELQYVLDVHHYTMCERIRELHDWIIVPLEIEVAIAPVDAPWYDTKDYIRIQDGTWVQKDKYKQNDAGLWFPRDEIAA